jgi:predicted neuraminidase
MFAKRLSLIVVLLNIFLISCVYAQDIAQWDLGEIGQKSQLTDRISKLNAELASKHAKAVSVVSKDGENCLFFKNSANDSDPNNAMFMVEDNDVLTGHNDHRYGYTSFTIELQIMPTEIKQCQLIRKTQGATEFGYQLWMTDDGKIGFGVGIGEGLTVKVMSKRKVEVGKWQKILATWDGRYENYNMQLNVDGYITWGGAGPTVGLTNTASPMSIGGLYRDKGNYGQFYAGYMKDIKLSFNRPELLNVSGKCDPYEIKQTGQHLKTQPGYISGEFIYNEPPTPECHASTIVSLGDGKLAAAWFGGTHEGHTDIAVWLSIYENGKWSKPKALVRSPLHNQVAHISLFNPVLFKHSSGRIMLFYKEGWVENMESRLITSDDNGLTWSDIRYYEPSLHGPSKNKPIELSDGSILCAANGPNMEITPDRGQSWKKNNTPNPKKYFGVIQGTILSHPDKKLQALFRTREGKIAQSWSKDNGQSWSDLELTNLPNNNSGLDAVNLKDGRYLLVYNHAGLPNGKWGGPRTPLNVAISDDGIKWQSALVLEDEPGEYSYPAVIQDKDGLVHITYTWHRMRIKHVVVDPEKLSLKPIAEN